MKRTLRWGALCAVVLIAAGAQAQIVVYDDARENGWQDYSYPDPLATSTLYVHGGSANAIVLAGNNFNAVAFHQPAVGGVTTASYPIVHFWVNGGAGSGQQLAIFIGTGGTPQVSASLDQFIAGNGVAANQWREVTVDIRGFYAGATYDRIDIQAEDNGTTYFDDIAIQPPAAPPSNAMQYSHDITTLPAVSPMQSDQITWQDSAGHPRSAVLAHDNTGVLNPDFGNTRVYGEALRQFTYQLSDGSIRTADVTTYGNGGYGGFGYVVDHSNDYPNCVGDDSPLGHWTPYGTYTRVFEGRHHSIYRYTQNYPRNCSSGIAQARTVPVTIEWVFSTGRDNPLYAITYDVDQLAPNGGANVLDDDSRAPYGELNIDGDGGAQVDGVAWGDRKKFTSTSAPVTLSSSWDYTAANTVPYIKEWYAGALTVDHKLDATMGLVQTQTIDQQDAGGARQPGFHDITVLWGHTSADNPANPNGYNAQCPYTMPCANEWAYQANADNLGPGVSNNNTRMTWRTQWGFIGQTLYDKKDPNTNVTGVGYPKQSYSVFVVMGQHSALPVDAQVTQIETVQNVALSINNGIGSVVTTGPAGVVRADNITYQPAGYNHVRGAFAFSASSNALDANITVGAGTLKNPMIIVSGYTSASYPTLKLGGATLTADSDYYASIRAGANELWITLNRNLAGANHLEILAPGGGGGGVPGAPSIGEPAPGSGTVGIYFTPPASDGGSPITSYTATCNPGAFSASGPGSPIVVGGLTSGIQYSCSVTATNANGTGPASLPVVVTLLNNRSFVATTGNDANNCTASALCRSFSRAIAMTYPGGEIIATTSGGYGAFVINNAITVVGAPGITASLTVAAGDGIDVAANASDGVTLRGLNITMLSASHGIFGSSYASLAIDSCSITGGDFGVYLAAPSLSFATVVNTSTTAASAAGMGIFSRAALIDCTIERSGNFGLFLREDAAVSAVRLVSVANTGDGVYAESLTAGHHVALDLDHAMLMRNGGNGVWADGSGPGTVSVRVTHSSSTDNTAFGFAQTGTAQFQSLSNNLVAGNTGGNSTGTITPIAGH